MPVRLELPNESRDLRGLLRAERGGRFVHDQDPRVEQDGARDRDRLALTAGQVFDRILEALEMRIETAHDCCAPPLPWRCRRACPSACAIRGRERDWRRCRHCRRAPATDRSSRCRNAWRRADWRCRFLAANGDGSGIARIGAGENLDQRRFAGAVMADQRHDFAGMKIDRHPIDGVNAAEGERNVAHLDKRSGGTSSTSPFRRRR